MLDLGKGRICILVPSKIFGVVSMMAQEGFSGGNEIRHDFEHSASNPTWRQRSKPPLDHIQSRSAPGRAMEVHAGVSLEPALHSRTFMRTVRVNEEMQLELRRRGWLNGLQKPDKLLTLVARYTLPDDCAIEHVGCGQKGSPSHVAYTHALSCRSVPVSRASPVAYDPMLGGDFFHQ